MAAGSCAPIRCSGATSEAVRRSTSARRTSRATTASLAEIERLRAKAWGSAHERRNAERRHDAQADGEACLIGAGVSVLTLAAMLMMFAFRESIVFFHTPSDIAEKQDRARDSASAWAASSPRAPSCAAQGTHVDFAVTDTLQTVPVTYEGVLPDLFREGQGVVAEGTLDAGGQFVADTVLAKHDETYMPPEVAKALKEKGVKLGEGATHPEGASSQ